MSSEGQHRAFIALGSNIQPAEHLPAAIQLLHAVGQVVAVSRMYESPPVGFADQANFVNGVVLLETRLTAAELKQALSAIETRLGRVRDPRNRNAPRTIDLDIALFDRDMFDLYGRPIPDPELLTRNFLAIPIAELAPELIHPHTGTTLAEMAARFDASQLIRRLDIEQLLPGHGSPANVLKV